jgi:hypothetical protein
MKKRTLLVTLLFLLAGTAMLSAQTKPANSNDKPLVLVYYFHGTNRCATCLAIEDNTQKTLQTYFAKEVKEGTVKFQSVNVDEEANIKLAEKYEASGSALFVTKVVKGKETKEDMTNFAFSYGRNNPEKFMLGLKDQIAKDLK